MDSFEFREKLRFLVETKTKIDNDQILKDFDELMSHCIVWSIEDFEQEALMSEQEKGVTLYDRTKFPDALKRMIHNHDAMYGITWYDVTYMLEEYCLIDKDE